MPNQTYTKEFRKEAVKLALESDEPKQKIADNLGVKYKTLLTVSDKFITGLIYEFS